MAEESDVHLWATRTAREYRRAAGADDGFTLIESVVALVIIAIVFMGLAVAAISGVRATVGSRLNQQAGDLINRAVEQARAMNYAALTMATGDLTTGDPGSVSGTPPQYNVPKVGYENVDAHTTGAVSPHVTTITANVNNATFKLYRYVTVPAGATFDASGFPSVKRFTAVVTWKIYGRSHSRIASTLLTDTVRGLPLPNFTLRNTGPTARTVNPDTTVDFGFAVHNLGARDSFNFSVSSSVNPALANGWTFYLDDGYTDPAAVCAATAPAPVAGDAIHECAETHTAGNWDAGAGNTQPDTGPMDPNTDLKFVAERTATSSDIPGGDVNISATSTAQPTASSATHSLQYNLVVQTGGVTGGTTCPPVPTSPAPSTGTSGGSKTTLNSFYLNNRPLGDTSTQVWNPMARGDCTSQSLSSTPDYSNDFSGDDNKGRLVATGGTVTGTTSSQEAVWKYQPASTTDVDGTAVLTIYVQCSSAGTPALNAAVGLTDGTTNLSKFTSQGQGSTVLTSCPTSGWQKALVSIPITKFQAQVNKTRTDFIGLRVWTTGGPNVRLLYDYNSFVSFLVLAVNP